MPPRKRSELEADVEELEGAAAEALQALEAGDSKAARETLEALFDDDEDEPDDDEPEGAET